MSCSRGSTNRTRPQKHQNRSAFKNTLHDTSKKTKLLNNLEVTGVCERCKEIIEWKIKYKKYKPLTAPKKCAGCDQKNIKHAYHILCSNCASDKNVCTKCCKPIEVTEKKEDIKELNNENQFHSMLKGLPERKRRTILRHIKKQQEEGHEMTNTIVEHLMLEMGKVDLDDDFSDSDDYFGSEQQLQ
ncbi:unnamed protein product, partial [Brenthis ino]